MEINTPSPFSSSVGEYFCKAASCLCRATMFSLTGLWSCSLFQWLVLGRWMECTVNVFPSIVYHGTFSSLIKLDLHQILAWRCCCFAGKLLTGATSFSSGKQVRERLPTPRSTAVTASILHGSSLFGGQKRSMWAKPTTVQVGESSIFTHKRLDKIINPNMMENYYQVRDITAKTGHIRPNDSSSCGNRCHFQDKMRPQTEPKRLNNQSTAAEVH